MSYMTFKPLTAKQKALLNAVHKGAGEGGIYGLATALKRDPRRVFDNVSRLESLGYVLVSSRYKNGREIKSVTPAVTGSVMTVVNVSLPKRVSAKDLVAGLKEAGPLSPSEEVALTSFFADVPPALAIKFLNEHEIPLTKAATAYKWHVLPLQRLPRTEAWLNVDSSVETATP
jgi:hypothetical protein